MRQYRVARQTVQNAFDLLRGEGMIVTRPGAGAFVRTRPAVQHLTRNRLERSGRRTLLDGTPTQGPAVPARTEPADEHTANILGVRLGAEILVRERVLHADGEPIQLATSRLRPAAAGQARDHFVEYVSTRPARPEEATSLMLSSGTPVLCVTRIAFDNEGTAVELNDMVLPGDRYQLIYEIPAD